ncbi:MAG: NAD(P)/FAD-dependent oxidoreductase, partial [Clostridia bacterium]|nr:NAD(P)/FAD-dependent oxidoreductase [Clostridia bacterium]
MLYDVIIIGGGASGLLAAATLSRRGRRVALLEKQARVGRKLLSTGNGRCNLTNRNAKPSDYHGSWQAAQYALKLFPPKKVEAAFEALGVPCVADGEGRVYPMSRQAASVLDALRLACDERGADTLTDFCVTSLTKQGDVFEAAAKDGRAVRGRSAIVCTGGLAAPKLGASGEGYRLLEGFGHATTPR